MAEKLNIDEVMTAAQAGDNIGFCTACGNSQSGVEPDARKYTCEACGRPTVYGAEELLLEFGI